MATKEMPLSTSDRSMNSPKGDLVDQIAAVERAYGGISSWQREVEAKNTQLSYEHWLVAKTPEFKSEWGDWEAKIGVERLNALTALDIGPLDSLGGKSDIKATFKEFGRIQNSYDHREVIFPASIAGKLEGHMGYDVKKIAKALDRIFINSVPMNSVLEEERENHKVHTSNIKGYHNYIGKFKHLEDYFYIRFTVQQTTRREGLSGESQCHSAFVSSVLVYENSVGSPSAAWGQDNLVITESSASITRYDQKLASWLIAGKQKISPNGQPLEHREPTDNEIKEFLGRQRIRTSFSAPTLPISNESQSLVNAANALRKLRKNPNRPIGDTKELKEFEERINSITGPGLTAIPLKRIAIAVSEGKCSDKKLRKACLDHENAISRSIRLSRGSALRQGKGIGIDL